MLKSAFECHFIRCLYTGHLNKKQKHPNPIITGCHWYSYQGQIFTVCSGNIPFNQMCLLILSRHVGWGMKYQTGQLLNGTHSHSEPHAQTHTHTCTHNYASIQMHTHAAFLICNSVNLLARAQWHSIPQFVKDSSIMPAEWSMTTWQVLH